MSHPSEPRPPGLADVVTTPTSRKWTKTSLGTVTSTRPIGAYVGLTVDHPGQIDGRPARGQRFEGTLVGLTRSELSLVYYRIAIRGADGTTTTLDLPLNHQVDIDEPAGRVITPEGHVDDVGCWCGPMVDPVAGVIHTLVAEPTVCGRCGCTDDEACPGGCSWARPGLCSRCVPLPTGADLIAAERRRQVEAEGWTPEHDAQHGAGLLYHAGVAYKWGDRNVWPRGWEWKPKNELRDLIRAGALFQAALDVADATGDAWTRHRAEQERDVCARLIDELLLEARTIDRQADQ